MSLSVLTSLGAVSVGLQVTGYLLYIRHILRHSIRPNAASWFMFAYGTALLAFLERENGASAAILGLPFACATMGIIVSVLSFRKGASDPVDRFEIFVFSTDLWLTVFYIALTYSLPRSVLPPTLAVGFLIAVNATAVTCFLPILRSTWQSPERERASPWAVWTLAYICLAVTTLQDKSGLNPALLLYPVLNAFLHGAVFALSLRKYGSGTVFKDDADHLVIAKQSAIHGLGMFAGRPYGVGEELWVMNGRPIIGSLSHSDPNAIGFASNFWIDPDAPFDRLNHSCEPNAAFGRSGEFYAIRPIAKGEEITMDYSTTEADPDWVMKCDCGAATCRRELRAIQIAFADSAFPPPAAPGMQMVWRDYKMPAGAEKRSAFPQLGTGASDRPVVAQDVMLPDGTSG